MVGRGVRGGCGVVVYQCNCHFRSYSLHFSKFIQIYFTRKQTKYENTRSLPFSYDMKMASDSY